MRYLQIDTVSFTDVYGVSYSIKAMREYVAYATLDTVDIIDGDRPDEIISRSRFYGDGSERDTYRLIDHNIVEIVENNFEIQGLNQLKVPVR